MEALHNEIDELLAKLPAAEQIRERLDTLVSVYPFNEYEFVISHLLAKNVLSLEQYLEMRDNYIARNMYLYIFEISAPRTFGEAWAQGHLKELVPELAKSTKKLDSNYSGQYDFLLDGRVRIEVKASRAVDAGVDAPLYVKALSSVSTKPFWMNFQQIKPACCDVIVWIAVWRDQIRYWVLSSHEVETHPDYSKTQHRGNVGEGQFHVTNENIGKLELFRIASDKLAEAIRAAFTRQKTAKHSA
ncbi:MAG: hypothetical protein JSS27_15335 [Planctomycetes bacterium]|nr:hypothetical protein [Planctomycetota bacterium]